MVRRLWWGCAATFGLAAAPVVQNLRRAVGYTSK